MATARLYNLARMDTATTGTGTVTLGSAVTGFLTFAQAGVADGATVTYAIKDGNNSEIGRGVYTSSGTTLTRATILNSTNSNNALNLSGSGVEVFITPSAQDFLSAVNAQTGTTYTVLATDLGKLVTHSNAASIAVTLPQATGLFAAGWYYYTRNLGAGTVTITPTTSTIDGAATLVLATGASAIIFSDGTNYQTVYVPIASETVAGLVERATDTEAAAGSDTTRYVTSAQLYESRVDVASATTTDIGAAASNFVRITGTTTITGLGTAPDGVWRDVVFEGALTLTYNGTSLLIPGAANVTTAANDRMRCRSLGSGNWIVLDYTRTDGTPLVAGGGLVVGTAVPSTSGTAIDFTGLPSGIKRITVIFNGVSTNSTNNYLLQIGDSGGIENTSYSSAASNAGSNFNSTSAFVIAGGIGSAASAFSGSVVLTNISGNIWVSNGQLSEGTTMTVSSAGVKTLSAVLDRIRITTASGSDTFDAGSINIMYET